MMKPSHIALVVCDNVYRESGGKTALVGLFNQLVAEKFPARHARLCVYVSVTGVRPNTKLRLEIVHSETDHTVATLKGPPPKEADPTTICDFDFTLGNLIFPEPGLYYIRFWGNDHLLAQRPFAAIKAKRGEDKGS